MSGGPADTMRTDPGRLFSSMNPIMNQAANQFYSLGGINPFGQAQIPQAQNPMGQYRNFPVTNPYQAMFQDRLRMNPMQYMYQSPYRPQIQPGNIFGQMPNQPVPNQPGIPSTSLASLIMRARQ